LNMSSFLFGIDVENAAHKAGAVHYHTAAGGLSREAGAGASGGNGKPFFLGLIDKVPNIIYRFWKGYTGGNFLVDGCIISV